MSSESVIIIGVVVVAVTVVFVVVVLVTVVVVVVGTDCNTAIVTVAVWQIGF